jgi:nucleoside-diphosphate-sugar epimerase
MIKRKAAIVSGASGYVGSNLVRALLEAHWDVTCIVRKESKPGVHSWHRQVQYIIYDGTFNSLINAGDFADCNIVVFHLASTASYHCPGEQISEMVASNITFGAHVLEAMRHWGAINLVNTGTFWQYDKTRQYKPVCLYAATKEAFEDFVSYYMLRDKLKCITLVLFDIYGANDPREKIIQLLNEHSRTGTRLALSPGMQKIDLVYVTDVVAAFIVAADRLLRQKVRSQSAERFAVSSGARVTLKELVATYEKVMSVSLNVAWGGIGYREREIMVPWQPTVRDKLEGWRPRYGLYEGLSAIKETIA